MPDITVVVRKAPSLEFVAGCIVVAICLAVGAYWVVRDGNAAAAAKTECAQAGRIPAQLGSRFVCVDADKRVYLPH